MADFKKLRVWQHARSLAFHAHHVAGRIRGPQYSSLRSQMIRAAMSIPANIVEGRSQVSEREFTRYLRYVLASASELEAHLIMAQDFGVITESDCLSLLSEVVDVRKMLHGLLDRLSRRKPVLQAPSERGADSD
jgi:four helix bundle protein